MLTSQQITTLLERLGRPGIAGAVEATRRSARDWQKGGNNTLTSAQAAMLKDVAATPATPRGIRYVHPANASVGHSRTGPLSPAQVAWLGRLPTEPADVPHKDAQEVFRMLATLDSDDPAQKADLPLLRAIADPLRDHHDRLQAEADLDAASQPRPPIPSSALNALAEAIANENQTLEPHEAFGRAHAVIADLAGRRDLTNDYMITGARRRLAELGAKASRRTATTVTR